MAGLLRTPKNSPTRCNDGSPSTTALHPSILLSTDPFRSHGHATALDFVEYKATPTKRWTSFDSPSKGLELFETQTLSPPWSQPRSFERRRLRDHLDSQHPCASGRAGLEAEAEGHEPGEGLRPDELENLEDIDERETVTASSVTEADSQDMVEALLKKYPECRYAGDAPEYLESSPSSVRSSNSVTGSTKGGRNDTDSSYATHA